MKKITSLAISLILIGCSADHQEGSAQSQHLNFASPADESLSPESQEIYHFLLGEIALDRDQPTVALDEYHELNKTAPEALTAARATSIAIDQNDFIAAARSAKIWADATPDDMQTQAIATSIFLKNQDIDGALPFLERLVTQHEKDTFDNLILIRSTLEDEKHAQSFVELMKVYGINHQDYRTLFMGATTAQEIKDLATAKDLSERITKIDPNWTRGAVLSVQLLYESGDIDGALKSIAVLIQNNPKEGMFRYLQAKMMLEKGDLNAGVQALNTLKADPLYRNEALMDLARISVQRKDFSAANDYLTQYLTFEPHSDEAKYFAGYVAQQMGNQQAALARFKSVKPSAYYVNAKIQSALILGSEGEVDQALNLLAPLMTEYPKDGPRIELVRTQILLDANRIEEAYLSLNEILKQDSGDAELRYIRGLIAMELGHNDQAESDFRFVIEATPTHLEAINDLSTLLITQKKYGEAKFFVEKAMTLAPQDARALGNMGWLLQEQGQSAAALEYLEKAHTLSQDDVIAAHFGQALWENGKREDAMLVWNTALKTHPNDPILLKVMSQYVTPATP